MRDTKQCPAGPGLGRRDLLVALAAALPASVLLAQGTYPSRPVKLVLGFPAGEPTDIVVRAVCSPFLQAALQPDARFHWHRAHGGGTDGADRQPGVQGTNGQGIREAR